MRGLTSRSLMVGTVSRTYLAYLPSSAEPGARIPFVYVFHGDLMNGQEMHDITHYADLAEKEGFAVVFPDGEGGSELRPPAPWNVEEPGQTVLTEARGGSRTPAGTTSPSWTP